MVLTGTATRALRLCAFALEHINAQPQPQLDSLLHTNQNTAHLVIGVSLRRTLAITLLSLQLSFIVALCSPLTGNLLSIAHQATVQHATCPEHGETLHAGTIHTERPSEADVEENQPVELGNDTQTSDQRSHTHEVCSICATSRNRLAVVTQWSAVDVASADEQAHVPSADATSSTGVALLLLAPKHSPPV